MFNRFFALNKSIAMWFERKIGVLPQRSMLFGTRLQDRLKSGMTVADVGGGKRPMLRADQLDGICYVGIDVDESELARAPAGAYHKTMAIDIQEAQFDEMFDVIICKNTLEHVRDSDRAIKGLLRMLKPSGRVYAQVPCSHAIFSKLNRVLPEGLKRRLLFFVFPGKKEHGFPAFYDRCTPSEFQRLIGASGGEVCTIKKFYWSSYFSFFLPLYVLWRAATLAQLLIWRADYCEKFEIEFVKCSNEPAGQHAIAGQLSELEARGALSSQLNPQDWS